MICDSVVVLVCSLWRRFLLSFFLAGARLVFPVRCLLFLLPRALSASLAAVRPWRVRMFFSVFLYPYFAPAVKMSFLTRARFMTRAIRARATPWYVL